MTRRHVYRGLFLIALYNNFFTGLDNLFGTMAKYHKTNFLFTIGGDHGQGSMKLEFQLANLVKPNSSKKTVVFAIYEGKDTRNNLLTVLQQHADSLKELTTLKVK